MVSEAVGRARKWGNSIGIVLPKDFVRQENIEEGDEVVVRKRKVDLRPLRGLLKGARMTAQEFKDRAREGWGD